MKSYLQFRHLGYEKRKGVVRERGKDKLEGAGESGIKQKGLGK